jgi:hypothetical protein
MEMKKKENSILNFLEQSLTVKEILLTSFTLSMLYVVYLQQTYISHLEDKLLKLESQLKLNIDLLNKLQNKIENIDNIRIKMDSLASLYEEQKILNDSNTALINMQKELLVANKSSLISSETQILLLKGLAGIVVITVVIYGVTWAVGWVKAPWILTSNAITKIGQKFGYFNSYESFPKTVNGVTWNVKIANGNSLHSIEVKTSNTNEYLNAFTEFPSLINNFNELQNTVNPSIPAVSETTSSIAAAVTAVTRHVLDTSTVPLRRTVSEGALTQVSEEVLTRASEGALTQVSEGALTQTMVLSGRLQDSSISAVLVDPASNESLNTIALALPSLQNIAGI